MMAPAPTQRCCATCVWWSNVEPALATGIRRPHGAEIEIGICRRAPPTRLVLAGLAASLFPETHSGRCCGEWVAVPGGDGPRGGERATEDVVVQLRTAA